MILYDHNERAFVREKLYGFAAMVNEPRWIEAPEEPTDDDDNTDDSCEAVASFYEFPDPDLDDDSVLCKRKPHDSDPCTTRT